MFVESCDVISEKVEVFYRLIVDSNNINTLYAHIQHLSQYSDEVEYLFSLRSLFRIDQIELHDNLWYIDITVVDEDDHEFS